MQLSPAEQFSLTPKYLI